MWVGGSDNGHPGVWSWFSTGQLVQGGDWGAGQPRGETIIVYIWWVGELVKWVINGRTSIVIFRWELLCFFIFLSYTFFPDDFLV